MAEAASERSYGYIAITDHSKGLKIAGGIDERALKKQGNEIAKLNVLLSKSGRQLVVLRSLEMNLNRGAKEICLLSRWQLWISF